MLFRSLSIYEAKVNPKTNTISYNAPLGCHDDSIIALMLSNRARKYNNYSVI